jgi:hypothetical protein
MAVKTPKELRLTIASCIFYILMKFETILGVLFKTVTNFSFFSCRGTRLDHQNVVCRKAKVDEIDCLFFFVFFWGLQEWLFANMVPLIS